MSSVPSVPEIAVYCALAVFAIGLAWKVSTWFRCTVGIDGRGLSVRVRVGAAVRGIASTLFSLKVLKLLKVFLLDGVLQVRLLKRSAFRWVMHLCLYGGFMLLLLMHALGDFTTARLFADYQPTLNPFLFLRDLFGVLMILGVALGLTRRFARRTARLKTTPMDVYALSILSVILVSGILLASAKTLSHSAFTAMADEYAVGADEEQIRSLEAYWVENFGLAPSDGEGASHPIPLDQGKALHETNCLQCHSSPQWGFAGYGASRVLRPLAEASERANAPVILWYVHFLAALVGLAYLPFSKMFHLFTGPLSLLLNAVMERGRSHPANLATRQMIELDACTHCGACTRACAVGVVYEVLPNENILPSEKIASLKRLAAGKPLAAEEIAFLQQGMFLCTNCNRCTDACPVGINLWELWFSVREALLERTRREFLLLSPFSLHRGLIQHSLDSARYRQPVDQSREAVGAGCDLEKVRDRTSPLEFGEKDPLRRLSASVLSESFSGCYRCMTCSSSCPIVRQTPQPSEALGLLPHQIMHAIGFRLWDHIFSARMLWECLGCYQCQENCPQGVCVADVLTELKNLAIVRADRNGPGKEPT